MIRRKKPALPKSKCPFCQSGTNPDYRVVDVLSEYLSERGRVISRSRTGVCAKHQRLLAQELKRARHLALLPFVTRV